MYTLYISFISLYYSTIFRLFYIILLQFLLSYSSLYWKSYLDFFCLTFCILVFSTARTVWQAVVV